MSNPMKLLSHLTIIALVILAVGTSGCGKADPQPKSSESVTYICPMDCENGETYTSKIICPKCEMKLTKYDPNATKGPSFSTSIEGLPWSKPLQVINLKDGDAYPLVMTIVKKHVGNRVVRMLAYNGSVPGTLLKVPEGATVTIVVENQTDIETTLHSHGIRIENKFDGVPNLTQKPIGIGESFTYKITFPDAGIYWYHPHLREDYAQEMGLYGNYMVTPKEIDFFNKVNREEFIVLDDVLIEGEKIKVFYKDMTTYSLMGRYGNYYLINGDVDYHIIAKRNEVIRFFITNVSNTRVFNFAIQGTKLKLVGADLGKFEHEEWAESVMLAPAERSIIEVHFDKSGDFSVLNKPPGKAIKIGSVHVEQEAIVDSYAEDFATLHENQDVINELKQFRPFFEKEIDKELNLSIEMNPDYRHAHEHVEKIEWYDNMPKMNEKSNSKDTIWKLIDAETNQVNMKIDWQFKVGDKIKIRIFNDPKSDHPMHHPIHFHGQRFLVLSTNGKANMNLAWKDTVLVQTGDYVEILMDVTNPGKWMGHCHIAEHLSSGMMMKFEVVAN